MKKNFLKHLTTRIFFILITTLIFNTQLSAAQKVEEPAKLHLFLDIPASKLVALKSENVFSITELFKVIESNLHNPEKKYSLGITCQAVTPMGKLIGTFNNPDHAGKSIPGGQSKTCNLWLIDNTTDEKDKKISIDDLPKPSKGAYPTFV